MIPSEITSDLCDRLCGICPRQLRSGCDRLPGETDEIERFKRAVVKANVYHTLLKTDNSKNLVESVAADHIFVKAERRYFKIQFRNILFIEGLKDYVVIQTPDQRIVTKMNLKSIHEMLPKDIFLRTNKSYIVNTDHIDSFDNNDVFIRKI